MVYECYKCKTVTAVATRFKLNEYEKIFLCQKCTEEQKNKLKTK